MHFDVQIFIELILATLVGVGNGVAIDTMKAQRKVFRQKRELVALLLEAFVLLKSSNDSTLLRRSNLRLGLRQ